jgi:hypothetical protein
MTKKTIMVAGSSVLMLFVAGGLLMLAVLPRVNNWRAISARIVQVEAAVKEREDLLKAAEALETGFSEALKNQERVKTFLPSQRDPAGSMAMISGLAAAHGVILEEVGFSNENKTSASAAPTSTGVAEASQEAFHAFTLSIRASGSYQALRVFLGVLAQSLRLTDVRTLTLSPQESGSDLITMKAELNTYYKDE